MCKFAGVKIYIHTKRKIFDPANPLEENDLHNEAVQSARRSAEISEAVTREMKVNLVLQPQAVIFESSLVVALSGSVLVASSPV
ncbi:hypothetical protein [Amycolatopsis methanolica]|uniref:hypothetical protein n=1 Tax=Amycolatopsis methanolica TaxID=1814 RepID=UPI003432AF62